MHQANHLNKISGWILADGEWYPTDEWWHINAIYDLRDKGHPDLQSKVTNDILQDGDESKIRDHLAELCFIKISRSQIDGIKLNRKQLVTLQNLLSLCDPEAEIGILGSNGILKFISIGRIIKLKNPQILFD
ncbi:hypothetical protein [Silvanigrella aquatica]|uniref:Uncharacterized protein n=1 Tax=Silvanigrella aquatica TaxID=1915309 RepID=A0A1L4D3C4_9BACT|nr:hypothetical protein [Silvanigrella aquatica]APJ04692.1 hypothetical protein AXG55_12580 [Silvanigrella aquatica]